MSRSLYLLVVMKRNDGEDQGDEDDDDEHDGDGDDDEMSDLQIEALVLMQMLTAYDPDLKNDMAKPAELDAQLGVQVVGIEVVWQGVLQQRQPQSLQQRLEKHCWFQLILVSLEYLAIQVPLLDLSHHHLIQLRLSTPADACSEQR